MGELVPVKYRFLANAVIFAFSLPTAGVGPAVSTSFILNTGPGWRWCYYFLIIANLVPAALYLLFYHPPTFKQKHGDDSIAKWIKNFDFVGLMLYCAGLILFILGEIAPYVPSIEPHANLSSRVFRAPVGRNVVCLEVRSGHFNDRYWIPLLGGSVSLRNVHAT